MIGSYSIEASKLNQRTYDRVESGIPCFRMSPPTPLGSIVFILTGGTTRDEIKFQRSQIFAPKAVSRCALYALEARNLNTWKGKRQCGRRIYGDSVVSSRVCSGWHASWGARYGCARTRKDSRGTKAPLRAPFKSPSHNTHDARALKEYRV